MALPSRAHRRFTPQAGILAACLVVVLFAVGPARSQPAATAPPAESAPDSSASAAQASNPLAPSISPVANLAASGSAAPGTPQPVPTAPLTWTPLQRPHPWYDHGLVRLNFGVGYLGSRFTPESGDGLQVGGPTLLAQLQGGYRLTANLHLTATGEYASAVRAGASLGDTRADPTAADSTLRFASGQLGVLLVRQWSKELAVLLEGNLGPGWILYDSPINGLESLSYSQQSVEHRATMVFGGRVGIGFELAAGSFFRIGVQGSMQLFGGRNADPIGVRIRDTQKTTGQEQTVLTVLPSAALTLGGSL